MDPTCHDLEDLVSDDTWERIAPLLPAAARTGRPRANDRRTVAAVLHVLGTGCRWCDLPREFGSYVTAWRRYRNWTESGDWRRIWWAFLSTLDLGTRDEWQARVASNPRARMTGVIAGRELWVEPDEFELAIDAAVDTYEDGIGLSAVMLSNGGFDSDWGL
ncbi:MAG: transposase [Myxococcota bacterium]|nr:transposase [Myxococcota bacterium]